MKVVYLYLFVLCWTISTRALAVTLPLQELNSLYWLGQFYQIGIPLTAEEVCDNKLVTCAPFVNVQDLMEYHVTTIKLNSTYVYVQENLPDAVPLYFPKLTSLIIDQKGRPIRDQRVNILTLIGNLDQLRHAEFNGDSSIATLPKGFITRAKYFQIDSFHQDQTFNFTNVNLPALENLTLYFKEYSATIIVESTTIVSLLIDADSSVIINLSAKCQSLIQLTLSLVDVISFTPSSLANFAIKYLWFYENPYPTYITALPLHLEQYMIKPLFYLEDLDLSNNNLTGKPPSYTYPLKSLDISNNPDIISIPDSFCTLVSIRSINTGITTVPDCFYCYWSDLPVDTFPPQVLLPIDFQCKVSLYSDWYSLSPQGAFFIQSGKNLGWGLKTSPFLVIRVPNTLAVYTPPISDAVNQTLYLSTSENVTITISWSTGDVYLQQAVGGLAVSVRHTDFKNVWSLNVSGIACSNDRLNTTEYLPHTIYCTTPRIFKEGPLSISIQSDLIGHTMKTVQFIQSYPIATSIDPVTTAGGLVTIHGSFGANLDTPSATINNINCPVKSLSSNTLVCQIGQITKGPATVGMIVDGYSYEANGLLYIIAQFEADGIIFGFSLYSVQELGPDNQVVKEIVTNSWIYSNTTLGELTSLNYTFNNTADPNAPETIAATIDYSTSARTISFAGLNVHISANGLKVSVSVLNWQYSSSLNTLQVVFTTKLGDYPTDCNGNQVIPIVSNKLDDSIEYLKVIRNGLAFYGRFLDRSLSDGRSTYSRNRLLNITPDKTAFIGISMPQCKSCLLDPDFSLIINPSGSDGCDNSASKWKTIVIAVACVAGAVAAAIAIIIYKTKKNKLMLHRRRLSQKMEQLRPSSGRELLKIGVPSQTIIAEVFEIGLLGLLVLEAAGIKIAIRHSTQCYFRAIDASLGGCKDDASLPLLKGGCLCKDHSINSIVLQ
eukprot:gene14969-17699_t